MGRFFVVMPFGALLHTYIIILTLFVTVLVQS